MWTLSTLPLVKSTGYVIFRSIHFKPLKQARFCSKKNENEMAPWPTSVINVSHLELPLSSLPLSLITVKEV